MSSVFEHEALFLFIPPILAGEHITGYAFRVSAFAIHKGTKMNDGGNRNSIRNLGWRFPSGVHKFRNMFASSIPPSEILLLQHTIFPILRPFIPDDVIATLRSHIMDGRPQQAANRCHLNIPDLSKGLPICKTCVEEDSETGTAYWKAAHFAPGLAFCPFHHTNLFTFCGQCVTGFRESKQLWVPRAVCMCGGNLIPIRVPRTAHARQVEISLSSMIHEIYVGRALEFLDYHQVLRALSRCGSALGLLSHGGPKRVRSYLENRIGLETINHYKFSVQIRSMAHHSLLGNKLPRNPMNTLLLIHALFGSLAAFVRFVHNEEKIPELMDAPAAEVKPVARPHKYAYFHERSKAEIRLSRNKFRHRIMDLIASNPFVTRSDLDTTGRKDMYYFLLQFDREWFDKVLPRRPFNTKKRESANLKIRLRSGNSIAAHVRARHSQLLQAGLPARITHRRLMHGHTLASVSSTKLQLYPFAKEALESCVESVASWHTREADMLLEQAFRISQAAPFLKDSSIYVRSPRSRRNFKKRIQKWLSEKAST